MTASGRTGRPGRPLTFLPPDDSNIRRPCEGAFGVRRDDEVRDEVLVLAALLGDLDSFDQLAARYRPAVVRTASAIVGPNHAEDIAQDALLLAFKALPSLEDPARFPAWLSTITRHRAMRFGRVELSRGSKRVEMDELLLARVGAISKPQIEDRTAEGEEVRAAMERIHPDYALALRLHFFDEMPLKRIAAYLGVPLSTIKWRLHRGKKLLREQIEFFRQERQESMSWNEKREKEK